MMNVERRSGLHREKMDEEARCVNKRGFQI
jgi:hypothetical protein